ncbi:MAG: hypothetical protein HOY76_14420 [Streptomyces sp.]|nr:hypothetical protein [Streptomyces sp.]
MGYTNPYVLLQFPEVGDDVSVLMRNPQLMPPEALVPEDVPTDEKGEPLNSGDAMQASYKLIASLIVAWKVYEAFGSTDALDVDPDADPAEIFARLEGGTQERIGKVSAENVGRLPAVVLKRIMKEIEGVANPQ